MLDTMYSLKIIAVEQIKGPEEVRERIVSAARAMRQAPDCPLELRPEYNPSQQPFCDHLFQYHDHHHHHHHHHHITRSGTKICNKCIKFLFFPLFFTVQVEANLDRIIQLYLLCLLFCLQQVKMKKGVHCGWTRKVTQVAVHQMMTIFGSGLRVSGRSLK